MDSRGVRDDGLHWIYFDIIFFRYISLENKEFQREILGFSTDSANLYVLLGNYTRKTGLYDFFSARLYRMSAKSYMIDNKMAPLFSQF